MTESAPRGEELVYAFAEVLEQDGEAVLPDARRLPCEKARLLRAFEYFIGDLADRVGWAVIPDDRERKQLEWARVGRDYVFDYQEIDAEDRTLVARIESGPEYEFFRARKRDPEMFEAAVKSSKAQGELVGQYLRLVVKYQERARAERERYFSADGSGGDDRIVAGASSLQRERDGKAEYARALRATVPEEAFEWALESASRGYMLGQWLVGLKYHQGTGCVKNQEKAFFWVSRAAAGGHAEAQCLTGSMCGEGLGTVRDLGAARRWLEMSAAQGDPQGINNLGVAKEDGWGAARPEPEGAAVLYERAAMLGNAVAAANLARLLASGVGVARDCVAAYVWQKVAAALQPVSDGDSRRRALAKVAELEKHVSLWKRGGAEVRFRDLFTEIQAGKRRREGMRSP